MTSLPPTTGPTTAEVDGLVLVKIGAVCGLEDIAQDAPGVRQLLNGIKDQGTASVRQ